MDGQDDKLIRTQTDVALKIKYPILFEKVHQVLRQHNTPVSPETIRVETGRLCRETTVHTILRQASWSQECDGGNYLYVDDTEPLQ